MTADVTTLVNPRLHESLPTAVSDEAWVREMNNIRLGKIVTSGIGAVNSGAVVVGVAVVLGDDARVVPLPAAAAVLLLGDSSSVGFSRAAASAGMASALSYRRAISTSQTGSAYGQAVIAANFAGNVAPVQARVVNIARGASFSSGDVVTTALGAMNVGLSELVAIIY